MRSRDARRNIINGACASRARFAGLVLAGLVLEQLDTEAKLRDLASERFEGIVRGSDRGAVTAVRIDFATRRFRKTERSNFGRHCRSRYAQCSCQRNP